MAAPLGTFVLASEWGDVSQVLAGHAATALSTTYLMRAGALCLVLTLAAAAVYVKLRGAKLASRKAAFVWSGCALTFAMAVRLLFNKYEWLALGEGPDKFFFGGLPVGLALAAAAGVLRRRR